jgi:hypothetical protein
MNVPILVAGMKKFILDTMQLNGLTLNALTGTDIFLFLDMLSRITEIVINIVNPYQANTAFESKVYVEIFHNTECRRGQKSRQI